MSGDTDGREVDAVARPAPAPDPQAFRIRVEPPRVMRLSRKALSVIGVVAGLGIGGSLIYALKPAEDTAPENLVNTENRTRAEAITSAPKDYSQVPALGPPLPGDLGRPILSAQQRGEDVPVPPIGTEAGQPDPRAVAAEQVRQRAAQERDAARTSSVFLGASAGADNAAAAPASNALAGLPGTIGGLAAVPVAPSASEQTAQTGQVGKRTFLDRPASARTISVERLSAPVSPHIVQAGSIIPAALITGIRSDLPGQITAQVTQNVYDSPTGRILLIPQGSRLIGEYDAEVSFGQNRVLLAWDRLLLPDGRSITLERQPGADGAGFAGLQDRTDYHWGDMAKAALLSTLLGVGAELGSGDDDDLVRALRSGTQNSVNQTGQRIVQRQLDVPPTLTIRSGHPLRVIVTRDLVLEPIGGPR